MNNDKDELIAEYGFRQEEIDNASQQITQIFGFSIAAIVALIGTSVETKNIAFLIGVFIIIFISAAYIAHQTRLIIKTETYLLVFVESDLKHVKWNQRLLELYENRKKENSKVVFTRLSIFSDFAALAYLFILIIIAIFAPIIGFPIGKSAIYFFSILSLIFGMLLAIHLVRYVKVDSKETANDYYYESLKSWQKLKKEEELVSLNKSSNFEPSQVKLVRRDGKEVPVPESAYPVLRHAINLAASGHAVSILPKESEVTIQEAANLLNVSCPLLTTLLEEGKIPYISVGSQKHIRFQDLMLYKEQQDAQRREKLRELTKFLQDEGFYEGVELDT